MDNQEDPLSSSEKKALGRLFNETSAPPHSFHKIRNAMQNIGSLRTPRPLLTASLPGILTACLLIIALLTLGFSAGRWLHAAGLPTTGTGKAKFVLLVHQDDQPAGDPMQQVREYSAWLHSIQAGRVADGEHLYNSGWRLHRPAGQVEIKPEENFAATTDIGGYFVFEAADAQEALRIAQTCPHLNYQGTLELRQIQP